MKFVSASIACALFATGILFAQQQAPSLPNQGSYPAETHRQTRAEKSHTPEAHGQAVDLNTASKKDIAALPGVGPDYAQTIIDARPFKSKEDLLRKRIIPAATYDRIKDKVTTKGPKQQSVTEGQRH